MGPRGGKNAVGGADTLQGSKRDDRERFACAVGRDRFVVVWARAFQQPQGERKAKKNDGIAQDP